MEESARESQGDFEIYHSSGKLIHYEEYGKKVEPLSRKETSDKKD